jgi:hypothetical protein
MARGSPLSELAKVTLALRRTEERAEQLRRDYEAAIVRAHEAGDTLSVIGQVAGLSRQRVWAIVQKAKEGK